MKKKTEKKRKPRLFIRNTNSGKDREIFGKKGREEFPRISRTITEKLLSVESILILKSRLLISLMISLVILTLVVYFGVDFYRNLQNRRDINLNREKIAAEIKYWQQVVGRYNNYRDGFFQLSVLEYKIGEKDQSRFYLQKVLELDPNFEAARKLEKLL